MRNLFYPKLALQNIGKNRKFYLPYILTAIGTSAMFYIMAFIAGNQGLDHMPGSASLIMTLGFGIKVIGIFSIIFLFYTNSFLMKRRKKELGLYNILGMEKRHIAKVLFFETLVTAAVSIGAGIACGVLFSKLMFLLLFKLITFPAPLGFSVSATGIEMTLVLFGAIFLVTFLFNLWQVRLAKPIELLQGGQTGEREPRTKKLLTAAGFITLGVGYAIALLVESPIEAMLLFFLAVVLVIIGTYCLFTTGSIFLLKRLRKNKAYYYQSKHFTSVSGMLYRMKQNAAGLASICVLVTMVLVMISITVCMYTGIEDALDTMYPRDVQIYLFECEDETYEKAQEAVVSAAQEAGVEPENVMQFRYYQESTDWNRYLFIKKKMEAAADGSIPGYRGQTEPPTCYLGFDLKGDLSPSQELTDGLRRTVSEDLAGGYVDSVVKFRADMVGTAYSNYGGFLFLGIFLGILFLMATVLIIYYKQISEGYDDRERFLIMQKVGMGREEIRGTIRSQVLTVFFLPILMAVIHVIFAFRIITKMLLLLNLTNVPLFVACTAGTVLVFCVIYALVYLLTARVYYRIVS